MAKRDAEDSLTQAVIRQDPGAPLLPTMRDPAARDAELRRSISFVREQKSENRGAGNYSGPFVVVQSVHRGHITPGDSL